ncbi:hypothetical protein DYQ86_16385 [Acidobacteria bacterium AB60]|nr:hypothetical protein DYQ86_16385 [Acidobacteria bacterium AB60]
MRLPRFLSPLQFVLVMSLCTIPAFATVTVSSPANGAQVTSPVHYVASATASTCSKGVASMGIYINNKLTYVTYTSTLDTSLTFSPGSYSTVVEEWDNCGGATYTPINIVVGTAQAGVVVTSPAPNSTVTSPVTYKATGSAPSCASGVAAMGIYVNNKLTYDVYSATLNTTLSLAPGSYSTVVEEWDNCGGATYTTVPITVVSSGTTGVNVTSPAPNSTVTSPVTYAATATSSTCAAGVAAMGIYVNNQLTYTTNSATLNTQLSLAPGAEHTVVEEWDKCGGAAYTTINLTVSASGSSGVNVTTPAPNSTVTSPVTYAATATAPSCAAGVASMGIYVNNQLTYTTNGSTLNTQLSLAPGAEHTVVEEWDKCGGAAFTTINLTVSGSTGGGGGVNVPTWHVDAQRSGLNSHETTLTPTNVATNTFGKLFSYMVDGYAYAEPLLMSNININGAIHNVLYVATENDSVYAFDADSYGTGAPLWKTSLLKSGETPLASVIKPVQGVTSTPVIDPSTNTIYVVSTQKSASGSTFRLNALDITTGAHKFGSPVTINASVAATNSDAVNGVETLTTSCIQRAALLLANNNIYMGFGSCHSGWLVAYNASTLAQTAVFNASPNLNGEGAYASAGGVWMGAGGPVADSSGNIYITTGNGPWDGKTAWGDSILKFSPTLQLEDYFTPDDYAYLFCADGDLAAGGLMMIPGTSELIAGGKGGMLYLVNSANMGHEQANDAGATQTLWFESDVSAPYATSCTDSSGTHTANINSYEIFGTSGYFNGSVYLGITPTANIPAGIREFKYSGGVLSYGTYTAPSVQQNTRGTTPFLSSNGTSNGILWMIDQGLPLQNTGTSGTTNATLRAYDATDLATELYNSSTNSADVPGYGIKFSSPVVANGKVYISTGHDLTTATNPQGEIDVYGLR